MATSRKDDLGDRMKRYEETTKFSLPRRTYTILRVDGRAFHTWTRGLAKPYDLNLMECMDEAAIALCQQISGVQFAYVQSDEISLLATDFSDTETQSWFDGNIQKWASVGASIATMAFNSAVHDRAESAAWGPGESVHPWYDRKSNAVFDARVFTIPDLIEVENYFVWRQQDAERNSVMMLARAYASHKKLAGKNRAAQHEIIHEAGDNWAKHPARFKHGGVIRKSGVEEWGKDLGKQPSPENYRIGNWFVDAKTPVFTRNGGRAYLRNLVPVIWNDDLLVRKAAANG
jgi:tRNA(His) guanylyltransferase